MGDDEFRQPLERRIASLRAHRELVQDELRERHSELNSIERRIQAAEELYRQEFGAEPPAGEGTQRMRRQTRIRRTAHGQLSWKDAVIGVLRDAGTPLHAKEIWQRLQEGGFESNAADPVRSVVSVAIRTPEKIQRTGPNTFGLVEGAGQDGQQRIDTEVAVSGDARERSYA